MADRQYEISILLSAIDGTAGIMGKTSEEMADLQKDLVSVGSALTIAGAAFTASIALMVKGAAEEETALTRLSNQLSNNGYDWEKTKGHVDDYVNSLTLVSKYSDDEIIPALQKMSFYTQDIATAQENLNLAMDLAATGWVDLDTAVKMVGQAYEGNIESLGRLIPELKNNADGLLDNKTASEKAEYALDLLQQKVGGMAEGEVKDLEGKFVQTKNAINDLADKIGDKLVPRLYETTTWIFNVVKEIDAWMEANPVLADALVNIGANLTALITVIGTAIVVIPKLEAAIKLLYVTMSAHPIIALVTAFGLMIAASYEYYDAQKDMINRQAEFHDKIVESSVDMSKLSAALKQTRIDANMNDAVVSMNKYKEKVEETTNRLVYLDMGLYESEVYSFKGRMDLLDKGIDKWKTFYNSITSMADTYYELQNLRLTNWENDQLDAQKTAYYAERNRILTTVEDYDDMQTQLLEAEQEYNDKVVEINDAADEMAEDSRKGYREIMRAKAIIDGSIAVVKTLAEYGGTPLGWASAAAIAYQTALQIDIINATAYARGGRNIPGGMALVGEEGPELVRLPGGADVFTARDTAMMAGAGGISVYVSGNYILDDMGAEGLADRISDVILQRVRNERQI